MSNIVSLILIIVSVGAFFGYMDPTYSNIKDLMAKNAQYQQELANSHELIVERDALLTKRNSFSQSDLSRLETLLPDAVDGVRLIIELDSIAKKYGLTIRNFSTGSAGQSGSGNSTQPTLGADNSPYGTYAFTFTTTASYSTFIAFLQALEHNLRLTDVVGVTFSAPSGSSAYDFTISIKTYWLK